MQSNTSLRASSRFHWNGLSNGLSARRSIRSSASAMVHRPSRDAVMQHHFPMETPVSLAGWTMELPESVHDASRLPCTSLSATTSAVVRGRGGVRSGTEATLAPSVGRRAGSPPRAIALTGCRASTLGRGQTQGSHLRSHPSRLFHGRSAEMCGRWLNSARGTHGRHQYLSQGTSGTEADSRRTRTPQPGSRSVRGRCRIHITRHAVPDRFRDSGVRAHLRADPIRSQCHCTSDVQRS